VIRCDALGCIRGIVHLRDGFGDPCKICGGAGELSLSALAKRIEENESTLRRILKPHRKMRVKVTARICAKLVDLIEPPKLKQPELFA
jgi:hypothetical protein